MSQIRLYFDEDAMDMVLVTALRNRGVDVRTVNELQTTGGAIFVGAIRESPLHYKGRTGFIQS
ncbi:hypothetical protein [Okeania sp. SIO3I5]|uniref:hypothetical protein n=1 Tax=Okeania sp. SIO3I5 TaxID=2607805 RepID=UPI0025DEAB13|nr:hypothetical protein [Okeania sp. SIO3I5]